MYGGYYLTDYLKDSYCDDGDILSSAILDYNKISKESKYFSAPNYQIIILNSKEGLEHLKENIDFIDDRIAETKSDLKMFKKTRKRVYEKFPELKDYKRSNQ